MAPAMRPKKITPPTTPPAMAPAFDPEGGAVEAAAGLVEAAAGLVDEVVDEMAGPVDNVLVGDNVVGAGPVDSGAFVSACAAVTLNWLDGITSK